MEEADVDRAIIRSRQELAEHYERLVRGDYSVFSRRDALAAIRETKQELAELLDLRRMMGQSE
jgi:hypothetical protein